MSKRKTIIETFRQRMIDMGKVITLPKDSPLREMLGMEDNEPEVEPTNTEEE